MRRLDLLGLKFGKLIVVEYSHRNYRHLYWKCLCDCGNETVQCTTNLRRGKVYSCGCERIKLSSKRLTLLPRVKFELGVASFNVLYTQYQYGAKRRHIPFELTKEEFKILTSGSCYYCGAIPKTIISRRGVNGEYIYNGIDRKDSSGKYCLSNCIPCCKDCNYLKMDLPYDIFLKQVKNIYEFLNLKGSLVHP